MSDAEFNQLAGRLAGKGVKKLALKGGKVLLWIGTNFSLFAGYNLIGVPFVYDALTAMTIAADVVVLNCIIR